MRLDNNCQTQVIGFTQEIAVNSDQRQQTGLIVIQICSVR